MNEASINFGYFGKENINPKDKQRKRRQTFTDTFSKDVDEVFPDHLSMSESESPKSMPKHEIDANIAISATAAHLQRVLVKWLKTCIINSEDFLMTFLRAREWMQLRSMVMNLYIAGAVAGGVLLLWGHCFAMTLSVSIGFYVTSWSSLRKYYNRMLSSFVDAIKEYEHQYHPRASTDLDYLRYGTHLIKPSELVLVLGEFVQMTDPSNLFGFCRDLARGCLAIGCVLYSYNIKCILCGLFAGRLFYDQFLDTELAKQMRMGLQPIPNGTKLEGPVWISMGQFFACSVFGVVLSMTFGVNSFLLDSFMSSFVGSLLCTFCVLRLARMNGYLSVEVDVSVGSNLFLLCFYTAMICGFLAQIGQLFGGESLVRGMFAPLTVVERILLRLAVWPFRS